MKNMLRAMVAAAAVLSTSIASATVLTLDFTARIDAAYNYHAAFDPRYDNAAGQTIRGTVVINLDPSQQYGGADSTSQTLMNSASSGCWYLVDGICMVSYGPPATPVVTSYVLDTPFGVFGPESSLNSQHSQYTETQYAGQNHLIIESLQATQAITHEDSHYIVDYQTRQLMLLATAPERVWDGTYSGLLPQRLEFQNHHYASGDCSPDGCATEGYLPGSFTMYAWITDVQQRSVPEPGSLALLSAAMLALAFIMRKRGAQNRASGRPSA